MCWPLVALAMTEQPTLFIASSTEGRALVSTGGIIKESSKDGWSRSQEATPEMGVASVFTGVLQAPTSPATPSLSTTEVDMLTYIKQEESGGNPTAQNPNSSAYGLYGFLDSTWNSVGCVKTPNPIEQERCGILYMKQRYGSIESAYYFHKQHNWY